MDFRAGEKKLFRNPRERSSKKSHPRKGLTNEGYIDIFAFHFNNFKQYLDLIFHLKGFVCA